LISDLYENSQKIAVGNNVKVPTLIASTVN